MQKKEEINLEDQFETFIRKFEESSGVLPSDVKTQIKNCFFTAAGHLIKPLIEMKLNEQDIPLELLTKLLGESEKYFVNLSYSHLN